MEKIGYAPDFETCADVWTALRRLDSLLERAVAAAELIYGPAAARDPFRGLHISLEEVASLLRRAPGIPLFSAQDQAVRADPPDEIGQRLGWLARTYALSPFEIDAILICLAPELDLRYERLYGYLQDDVTKKRPTVDLVLNLLCVDAADRLARRRHFTADSAVVRRHLLRLVADPAQVQPPLLGHALKIDERIVDFLLGFDDIDSRLAPTVHVVTPEASLADLWLPAEVRGRLALLTDRVRAQGEGLLFYFQGAYGVGKQSTAEALCRKLGLGLLVVDGERLLQAGDLPFDLALHLISREADLLQAAIYWQGFDALVVEQPNGADERAVRIGQRDALVQMLSRHAVGFLAGDRLWEPADGSRTTPFVRVEFAKPAYADRLRLWRTSLNGASHDGLEAALPELAARFRFSGGQIHDATATAHNLARWRDPDAGQMTLDDLYVACRLQSNRKLGELARKITPNYTWNDIVLPADRMAQLGEMMNQIKYRARVYDDWGFGRKLSLGKGLNVLFAGPSGTGKTMAAEIMANGLGLDLYKIDLSMVVSKYIGETEKNLARIFEEAETSNAILFFDEADALFGKRSEVRDSHDRYANIEISYLLQRMEEYDGIAILATNLHKNMDDAFVRRMHFTVEFPFPDAASRRRIWEQIWPAETLRSPDLDLDFVARRFELTGGSIRNVALAAAFLAADDSQVVDISHVIRATQREYRKMGRVVAEREFEVKHEGA